MTIAEKLYREFNLIDRDDQYFCNSELLAGFINRCEWNAAEIKYPYGNDSYDSTVTYVFNDGSSLTVSNPSQVSYHCFADIERK